MGIRKKRLPKLLAAALVVSLLAPSEMMVTALAAEADSVHQGEDARLQEGIATGSDAVKEEMEMEMKMSKARSGAERASETSGTCGENLTWELENGVLTISGTGSMENYMASSAMYEPRYAPWYDSKDEIKSVVVNDGVTSIGKDAFSGHSDLISVEFPNSLTSIGESAFFYCSGLTSVEFPSGLTSIGDRAFEGCSGLTSVEFPSGLTSIGGSAFEYCSGLTSVKFPSGVTSIGESAFEGCNGLTSVEFSSGVTSIEGAAFRNCKGLRNVKLPSSLTDIKNGAFYGCTALTDVYYAGSESDWAKINIEADNELLTGAAIHYNSTELNGTCGENLTWKLEGGVLTISGTGEMESYYGDSVLPWQGNKDEIKSVVVNDGVTSIGNYAFSGCSGLTSVEFPSGLTSIGNYAFSGCSGLTSVEFPSGLTSIGNYAFFECSGLTSIEIPTGVTSIGTQAFSFCSNLISAEIPTSVTSIENGVFSACSSLTSVKIPTGVASIGGAAFEDCSSLVSVEIPTSVTNIGDYAFGCCSSLTSVEIPTGVASIGEHVFWGCSSLTSVEIPTSVTSIGFEAFGSCSSLTSVEIPTGVISIGDYAFRGCSSLTRVEIPISVLSIKDSAFNGCMRLTDVYYAGSESDWTNITIGENNEPLTSAAIHYNSTGPDQVDDLGNVSINVESLGDAVLYVPYSAFVKLDNAPEGSQPIFRIADGSLPEGLELNEGTGEVSGMPVKAGEFNVTVEAVFGGSQDVSVRAELTILVKENTDVNIDSSSDEGYEVEQYIGNKTEQGYVMTEFTDQTFVSTGNFEEFIALWLNGQKLVEGEDYTKEEGSTRLTIRSQTFQTKTKPGSNTISAEFKDKDNQMKRTSQNFIVDVPEKDDTGTPGGGGGSDGGNSSGSGGSSSGNSSGSGGSSSGRSGRQTNFSTVPDKTDISLYHDDSWVKDEIGWRCRMPDGNWITNTWFRLPYQGTVEWYYFNEQGYMVTGLFEYNGLLYYLNPVSDGTQGKMITGWKLIDDKWYYFKEIDDGTMGAMMSDAWIGEYYVNSQGVWEE